MGVRPRGYRVISPETIYQGKTYANYLAEYWNWLYSINLDWHNKVPIEVLQLINENWEIVRGFASSQDQTLKFMGMKFPTEGFL